MRSSNAITWLLVLLVLVPVGVLAWLGFHAADAFDAVEATRLETEVKTRVRETSERIDLATQALESRLRQELTQGAADLAEALPFLESAEIERRLVLIGKNLMRSTGIGMELSLRDADGQAILPLRYEPADGAEAVLETTRASLLEHLRREADRRFYGEGGLQGSLGIWQQARKSLRSPALQALADVEMARLRAREDSTGAKAAAEARRLGEVWPAGVLWSVGRPLLLLWMQAAPVDASARSLLHRAEEEGRVAATPLTREERRRLRHWSRLSGGATGLPESQTVVTYGAPVSHGVQLRGSLTAASLREGFRYFFNRLFKQFHFGGRVVSWPQFEDPARDSWRHRFERAEASGLPATATLPVGLPGGAQTSVRILHRDVAEVVANRSARHRWITVGVVCLFLVTVLGLWLTRRALTREAAARRMRDEFIANVTHEVRTPLTSVLLHSEMLTDEGLPEERRREHASVVRAQGVRLAQLVDDMLDFAALERGTRTLEVAPVDLGAACREAVAPFLALAESEGIDVGYEAGGEEAIAMADPAALTRILANLLGNAWKHGRPARGGGRGRLGLRILEEAGVPTVDVFDNGPGIPAQEREAIFERFGRGRGAQATQGSGIGLSLSRDLARAMGGDIDVLDERGETVFRLALPPVPELEV